MAGHPIDRKMAVLDFGCGSGAMVEEYRRAGDDAYGCDIALERNEGRLRLIEADPYRLPFEDDAFDYLFSDQVFEHVTDHHAAIEEIWRVLRRGGVSLHMFPPKFRPIEAHVRVPLAGAIQADAWLRLWALLGVRNEYQLGKGAREVAEINRNYLKRHTNYLSRGELIEVLSTRFPKVIFAEPLMIQHSYGNARRLAPLVRRAPFLASIYAALYSRVVILAKG